MLLRLEGVDWGNVRQFFEKYVGAHALVGGEWMKRQAECPDHVGWRDFGWAPSLTSIAISERLDRGIEFGSKWYLSLLKPKGGQYRKYAALHDVDALTLRVLVGERAKLADFLLDRGVQGNRLKGTRQGAFTLMSKNYGYGCFRKRCDGVVKSSGFGGLLTLDVKDFFPSLSPVVMNDAWNRLNPVHGHALGSFLSSFNQGSGKRGLPIGNEGSSLLANQILIPVDRLIRNSGLEFFRFTDDYSIFLEAGVDVSSLICEVEEVLSGIGLCLNKEKIAHLTSEAEARSVLFDPQLDKLSGLPPSEISPLATEMISKEMESESPSVRRLNYGLGWVRDAGLAESISDNRLICELSPKKSAVMIVRQLNMKNPKDWVVNWMLDLLNEQGNGSALRHAAVYELGKIARESLPSEVKLTLDTSYKNNNEMPHVRGFAAECLGRLIKSRKILTEGAVSFADPTVQRASVLGIRHGGDRRSDLALRKVRSESLTAAPAAQWVLDGAA